MNLTANIIGATGLVGKQLVRQLLENDSFGKVRIFVRRDSGIRHNKLEQQIIDFRKPDTWQDKLTGDVLFSALGTTLRQAGSKEKQYEVDFTFNLDFAKTASNNGIKNYVLVSSIGANPKSLFFYTRMKGKLDEAVSDLGFTNLTILRPSSLIGYRDNKRIAESISIPIVKFLTKFFMKKFRPVKDTIVAQAMINAVLFPDKGKTIREGREIFRLSSTNSEQKTD